jgi:excisionase family DNA binding protein
MSHLKGESSAATEDFAGAEQVSQPPSTVAAAAAVSPYLTTEQVAARYHASVRAIRDWTAAGRLPYTRRPHARRLLFLRADLDAYDAGAELERVDLPDGGVCVRPVAP